MTKYLGIWTAIGTNMSASVLISNNTFFPLKCNLDKPYALSAVMVIAKNTPIEVINKLLIKYLENGIPDALDMRANSVKLFTVGFLTKNAGGYANNSEMGLNAWLMMNKIGNNIKIDSGIKNA